MEVVFDIFNDFGLVQGHKNAVVSRKGKEIHVNYNGTLNSAGFRTTLHTVKGYWYRLNLNACLNLGDMSFIYCESINPPERLVERKHFVTKNINQFKVCFQAVSSRTYLGLLFYNPGKYELVIKRFRVEAQQGPFETIVEKKIELDSGQVAGVGHHNIPNPLLENIKKNYQQAHQEELELQQIIQKNHMLVQEMLRESHRGHKSDVNKDELPNLDELEMTESTESSIEANSEEDIAEEDIVEEYISEGDVVEQHVIEEDVVEEDVLEENVIEEDVVEEDEENVIEEDVVEEDVVEEDVVEEDVVEEENEFAEDKQKKSVESLSNSQDSNMDSYQSSETEQIKTKIDKTQDIIPSIELDEYLQKFITFIVYSMGKLRYPKDGRKGLISVILGLEHEFHGFGQNKSESLASLEEEFSKWIKTREAASGYTGEGLSGFLDFYTDLVKKAKTGDIGPKLPKKRRNRHYK